MSDLGVICFAFVLYLRVSPHWVNAILLQRVDDIRVMQASGATHFCRAVDHGLTSHDS